MSPSPSIATVATQPKEGQRAGTSGLRKKVSEFQSPGFLENYIQSIFDTVGDVAGQSLVLGGDGRYFNKEALGTIARMAIAHGYERLIIGRDGILSTPAASHLVRLRGSSGAIILSASHNPGGPDGDFGVKYNTGNGSAAPTQLSERFHQRSQEIKEYRIVDMPPPDISQVGETSAGGCTVEVVDPVADYAALMESFFDFEAIGKLLSRPKFRIRFDAMHAVTGPYAREILERRLGAPAGSVVNAEPLEDFGGGHPDPNPVYASELCKLMNGDDPPDFGAASDGDGDRNMVLATGMLINPCDSLAIMLAYAATVPGFQGKVLGVARSMPTSRAVDRVARSLDLPCYETPTGWKYFGNLLEAGMISLCGEESFGTSSLHTREKDGLWSVLYWLDLIARIRQPPSAILRSHWARFGRDYFSRHDYEDIDPGAADEIHERLESRLAKLPGQSFEGMQVAMADNFEYRDPVDGVLSQRQGIRIQFSNGARIVVRKSGTGTSGATLRLYFDQYEDSPSLIQVEPQKQLAPLIKAAEEIIAIGELSGRDKPDLII